MSVAPPPLRRLLAEARAAPEYLCFRAARTALRHLPAGDGHAVLVYPGLLASDVLTRPLRNRLSALGYQAYGWGQGLNLGLRTGLLERMTIDVRKLADRSGRKVSLIGWSLGGLYARELAKRLPDRVRCVVTLGTPCSGDLQANNAWRLYELLNDHKVTAPPIDTDLGAPPPVPTTSVYSLDEGIVAARSALNPSSPAAENVAVRGSHLGLVWNSEVVRIIADRLAQPEGQWRPYAAPAPEIVAAAAAE